jgi:hypothetical protein
MITAGASWGTNGCWYFRSILGGPLSHLSAGTRRNSLKINPLAHAECELRPIRFDVDHKLRDAQLHIE